MKLGVHVGYWGLGMGPQDQLAVVKEAEELELPDGALGDAIAEHRTLTSARSRPGDPDRSRELHGRPGWAWLRPVRRLDDYERALTRLQAVAERPAELAEA